MADIEQLLKDIPNQPPVAVPGPARTVREAVTVEAGDLPQLDRDAANVFSQSEHILQDRNHVLNHDLNTIVLSAYPLSATWSGLWGS